MRQYDCNFLLGVLCSKLCQRFDVLEDMAGSMDHEESTLRYLEGI